MLLIISLYHIYNGYCTDFMLFVPINGIMIDVGPRKASSCNILCVRVSEWTALTVTASSRPLERNVRSGDVFLLSVEYLDKLCDRPSAFFIDIAYGLWIRKPQLDSGPGRRIVSKRCYCWCGSERIASTTAHADFPCWTMARSASHA